jgi:hypothetical protein
MRSVLVMMVFVTMLLLVVAQVADSCWKTPPPTPSTLSLPQDTADCDTLCDLRCSLKRGIIYTFCMQLCKESCGGSQLEQLADDSSSTTPALAPSTLSLPQDTSDCDTLCDSWCSVKRGIPQLYVFCMQLCKQSCGGRQLEQLADDSSSTTPSPTPSTLSLQQDEHADDCDKLCADLCHLEKYCVPKHYNMCLDLCKKHCLHPLSFATYHCTFACVDSMSTKLGSGTNFCFIFKDTIYKFASLSIC